MRSSAQPATASLLHIHCTVHSEQINAFARLLDYRYDNKHAVEKR